MDDDLRFTQSLGEWEAPLSLFQAMVKNSPELKDVEFRSKTRMGGTISLGLHRSGGWTEDTWKRVEQFAKELEKKYPGLVLLPEKA